VNILDSRQAQPTANSQQPTANTSIINILGRI